MTCSDEYDCTVLRTPLCITDDKQKFWKYGYEIYSINDDGFLTLIKDYDEN